MIYVGDKKAKLYHGDYSPAQFYKGDTKIAGYTDTEKVGAAISGVGTYNDALNPTIEGKSEQTVTANSPSPDYPSPIHSSENFDVINCGRNLFDKTNFVQAVDNEKPIVYNPNLDLLTTHGRSAYYISNFLTLPNLPSGVTVSGTVVGCAHRLSVSVSMDNWKTYKIFKENSDSSVGSRETIVIPYQTGYAVALVLLSLERYSGNNGYTDFQIEEGTVATPYQPYHATTAHVTDPLRSVGDVSDSIEVSEGKVEVVRRCGIKAFDGSEAWAQNDATSGMFYCDGWVEANSIVSTSMLCTHLKYMLKYPHIAGYFGNPTRSLFFNLGDSVITYNLTTFRDFLQGQKTSGTPITVLYQLAAPIRTDITATPLGQAMLALRTVPGHTQVFTNAAVPPVLRVKIKEML